MFLFVKEQEENKLTYAFQPVCSKNLILCKKCATETFSTSQKQNIRSL